MFLKHNERVWKKKNAKNLWETSQLTIVKEVVGEAKDEDLEDRRQNGTFASNKEMEKPELTDSELTDR